MAVATVEDLQGSIDVVVFPKVLEETASVWVGEQILLVSGRVDHKGEETVLLAESVWTWEQAEQLGPEQFAGTVAEAERSRGRGRGGNGWRSRGADGGNGTNGPNGGNGNANGYGGNGYQTAAGPGPSVVAVPVGGDGRPAIDDVIVRVIPRVSPLRGVTLDGEVRVEIRSGPVRPTAAVPVTRPPALAPAQGAEPHSGFSTVQGPADSPRPVLVAASAPPADDEPPWPIEAEQSLVREANRPTQPLDARPGQTLHVHFHGAEPDRIVPAFESLRVILRSRPGDTPVVLHIPNGNIARNSRCTCAQRLPTMPELVALVRRSVGSDVVDLRLAGPVSRGEPPGPAWTRAGLAERTPRPSRSRRATGVERGVSRSLDVVIEARSPPRRGPATGSRTPIVAFTRRHLQSLASGQRHGASSLRPRVGTAEPRMPLKRSLRFLGMAAARETGRAWARACPDQWDSQEVLHG